MEMITYDLVINYEGKNKKEVLSDLKPEIITGIKDAYIGSKIIASSKVRFDKFKKSNKNLVCSFNNSIGNISSINLLEGKVDVTFSVDISDEYKDNTKTEARCNISYPRDDRRKETFISIGDIYLHPKEEN